MKSPAPAPADRNSSKLRSMRFVGRFELFDCRSSKKVCSVLFFWQEGKEEANRFVDWMMAFLRGCGSAMYPSDFCPQVSLNTMLRTILGSSSRAISSSRTRKFSSKML